MTDTDLKTFLTEGVLQTETERREAFERAEKFSKAWDILSGELLDLVSGIPVAMVKSLVSAPFYGQKIQLYAYNFSVSNGSVFQIIPGITPGGQRPLDSKFLFSISGTRLPDKFPQRTYFNPTTEQWEGASISEVKRALVYALVGKDPGG
jgi:hypothetical protein